MKYIGINIKHFIKTEPIIFILTMLCILCSGIMLNFAFGLYHQYEQEKLDVAFGEDGIDIDLHNTEAHTATKGEALEMFMRMPQKNLDRMSGIVFEAYMPEDPRFVSAIFPLIFCIRNGKITISPRTAEGIVKSGILQEGRYFTAAEMENGELVALTGIGADEYGDPYSAGIEEKYKEQEDGTCVVDGKTYQCIGKHESYTLAPLVPIATVRDDCEVNVISVYYDNVMTRPDYERLCAFVYRYFGDIAEIPEYGLPDTDSTKFYNTLLYLCIFIISLTALIFAMLYEYILLQRKRQLTIYRLVGMSLFKARRTYLSECFLFAGVIYCVGVLLYHFVCIPYLEETLQYIRKSHTISTYGMLGMLYIGITMLILSMMIHIKLNPNIMEGLREV